MRESEARFLDLADESRTTHWEVDPKGLFTYVSHVSQISWGYSPAEVVGRMHFYDIHPEEGREAFKAAVFAAVEPRKQPFLDVVHAVETKDSRHRVGLGQRHPPFEKPTEPCAAIEAVAPMSLNAKWLKKRFQA